ncbi:MAG: GNAT family N-acetyltransferase [Pseudomonadota bacterium]|jgi:ribosomal protein S18 acetylase RimI-like enzyme|uniref:GNAT family N-acetyltransferase n=1 Tax=Pseudomonas sp. TaxID=306 RepID=UPI00272AF1C5|nr:GNAT family N-acetyltransferase [Pseudomonas sp.]MDQ3599528.1 GNAT family N-acetyltransferase [Pseudomonadota bacterium]
MKSQVNLVALSRRAELERCFALMKLLRPSLVSAPLFADQITRQFQQGYQLLGAVHGGAVVGLIGFREVENLLYGRFIYVDDLVVDTEVRHLGLGASLLEAVRADAVNRECAHLVLDTGLHMPLAQRFYYREGMLARGMHFVQPLTT